MTYAVELCFLSMSEVGSRCLVRALGTHSPLGLMGTLLLSCVYMCGEGDSDPALYCSLYIVLCSLSIHTSQCVLPSITQCVRVSGSDLYYK